jgi:hypothetical protein
MPRLARSRSRWLLSLSLTLLVGCAGSASDEPEQGTSSDLAESSGTGFLYFHGMSHLGIDPAVLKTTVGDADLMTPRLTDGQLEQPPTSAMTAFLHGRTTGVVSGYSLGRIPVFRLMNASTSGMTRVVMIDPTYDSAGGLGSSIGGPTAKAWLDQDGGRTFLLVYGDTTKELNGERSYQTALAHHPRAELCYIPGEHERFRQNDMAYALIATDCDDLKAHLDP